MTDAISASGLVKIFGRTRADRLRHFAPGLWLPRTTGGGAGVAGGGGVSSAADGLPDPDRARGVQPERGELPGRSDRRLWALPAHRKARGVPTDPLRIPQGTLNRRRGFRPPPDCFQAEEFRSAGLGYLRRLSSLPFLSYSSLAMPMTSAATHGPLTVV